MVSQRNVNVAQLPTCTFIYRNLSTQKTGHRIISTSTQLTFQCGVLCNTSCIVRRSETLITLTFSNPVTVTFYRASICEGGLGSRNFVRLSVCLSVRLSYAWIVTKLNDALQIFLYHTKGQSLCYSETNSGWWATLPSL